MDMPNAIKICNSMGGYLNCKKCPVYRECDADYANTEEFEKAVEDAATTYLKGKDENGK